MRIYQLLEKIQERLRDRYIDDGRYVTEEDLEAALRDVAIACQEVRDAIKEDE